MQTGTERQNVYQNKPIYNYIGYSVYCKKLNNLFSQKCKIFDTLVTPVTNYSSELWGMHDGKDIENEHVRFCRRILNVKNRQTYFHCKVNLEEFHLLLRGNIISYNTG